MKVFRFFVFFILLVPALVLFGAVIFVKHGVQVMSFVSVSYVVVVFVVLSSMWPGWKDIFGRRCPSCHKKFSSYRCSLHGKIVHKNELP